MISCAVTPSINHYNEGKQLVLIVAQPGTGKTGVVLETLKQLTTHIDDRNGCMRA